jgi:hypothetical protein
MVRRLLAKPVENPVFQLKSIFHRLVAHHEIFIGIILMELHELYPVVVDLFHHRICKPLCCKCLSNARRALKNNVLLFL